MSRVTATVHIFPTVYAIPIRPSKRPKRLHVIRFRGCEVSQQLPVLAGTRLVVRATYIEATSLITVIHCWEKDQVWCNR